MSTVLRLRTLHEQQARTAMGAAAGAVMAAEDRHARAVKELRGQRVAATTLQSLLLTRTVEVGLTEAADRASGDVHAARAAHDLATDAWRVTRAEQRAVERLVERRAAQARLEAMAAEQTHMDELAILARTRGAA